MIDIQAFQARANVLGADLALLSPAQLAQKMGIKTGALYQRMSTYGVRSKRSVELEKRREKIRQLATKGTIEEIREYIKLYHGQDITTDATRMAIRRAVGGTLFKKLRRRWTKLRIVEKQKRLLVDHCLWFMLWRYGLQMWIDFDRGVPAAPSRGPLKKAA